ncbi:hypothetical protein KR026_009662, partial [Drosophila bipectinata]
LVYFIIANILADIQSTKLTKILRSLDEELSPETFIFLESRAENYSCWNSNIFKNNKPFLSFNENQSFHLEDKFNSNFLALVCVGQNKSGLMQALYKNLQYIRDTPTVLFGVSEKQIQNLFLKCLENKMLNVLAFKGHSRKIIYSFRAFPELKIIKRKVKKLPRYFEPQLKDFGGWVLKTVPDNIMPRTVSYRDADGNRQLAGYLAHLIRTYVKSINATLEIMWDLSPEDGMIHLTEVLQRLNVDIPLGMDALGYGSPKQNIPMEISKWFLMIPMEPCLQRARFFYFTNLGFQAMILLAVIMLGVLCSALRLEVRPYSVRRWWCIEDQVLRGILAQPFILPRPLAARLMFIYWLLLISGFFMTNYYSAVLETWLINPPVMSQILSWQDMRSMNLKVLVINDEYKNWHRMVGEDFVNEQNDIFMLTDSADFQRRRLLMDPSYAYPVTMTLWPLLEQEQARLDRRIFRKSEEMVFRPFLILSIPLPDNSIFQKSFQRYVHLTHQSGLYRYWFKRAFEELRALEKISYKVDTDLSSYRDLKVEDYCYVWLGYFCAILASFVVYLLELGFHCVMCVYCEFKKNRT